MFQRTLFCLLFILPSCKQDIQLRDSPLPVSIATDTVRWSHPWQIQKIYNPATETFNPSCIYSNNWDLDGDHKNDSIIFVGNGGAHAYYYLKIILSCDGIVREFPSVQLDFPYLQTKKSLEKYGKHPGVQFVIHDFDKNAVLDIYLNFDDPFDTIPGEWQKTGVNTKYVLLSFYRGKLIVKDY